MSALDPISPGPAPGRPRPDRRILAPCLLALGMACGAAAAAPVDQDSRLGGPDPYELATRWTMASLPASVGAAGIPLAAWPAVAPAVVPDHPVAPRGFPGFTTLSMDGREAGVPDPGSYALMGLLLLAAGLAVQAVRRGRSAAGRGQRGFSKKT